MIIAVFVCPAVALHVCSHITDLLPNEQVSCALPLHSCRALWCCYMPNCLHQTDFRVDRYMKVAALTRTCLADCWACMQGFQQQDSHELLRVLLDGLQTEEAKAIAARLKHNSPEQVLPAKQMQT